MWERGQESKWIMSCEGIFEAKVGMYQGSVLLPFLFAVVNNT